MKLIHKSLAAVLISTSFIALSHAASQDAVQGDSAPTTTVGTLIGASGLDQTAAASQDAVQGDSALTTTPTTTVGTLIGASGLDQTAADSQKALTSVNPAYDPTSGVLGTYSVDVLKTVQDILSTKSTELTGASSALKSHESALSGELSNTQTVHATIDDLGTFFSTLLANISSKLTALQPVAPATDSGTNTSTGGNAVVPSDAGTVMDPSAQTSL